MAQKGRDPDEALKTDRVLDTLSHHLRREVIRYFETADSQNTTTLEDLATQVARRVPETTREQVVLGLAHNHLPKLESNGWVEHDTRTQRVRYLGHDSAATLLDELAEMLSDQPYSSPSA
ncbi:DUF7344 domain-containing protein [Halomicrococcus gelatinilyticus]|uniref:DUF7344 domain-containing protein n=1 Tax=Halomicrococcus gelatinilyticus TaxID=1702103 RepID=UPI002E15CB32